MDKPCKPQLMNCLMMNDKHAPGHRDARPEQDLQGHPCPAELDLPVQQHSIFGFLGPNGAGKTTTIKLLLGLAQPTGGSARSSAWTS